MNSGKLMERQWRESALRVPGLYYQRMNDGTALFYGGSDGKNVRFQKDNPYDCFMYLEPTLYLIELKSHKGASIPFSAIRDNQIEALDKASAIHGIEAGFVVHFPDKDECWYVEGHTLAEYKRETDRKSIPLGWFRENGVRVELFHKRVNTAYDVLGLTIDLSVRRLELDGREKEVKGED